MTSETQNQNDLKKDAALAAVDQVRPGMVVGLGSGSTANFATIEIGHRIKSGALTNILGIPSSVKTEKLAVSLGIPLTDFDLHPAIDITIDGADEVDQNMDLIKGGGGALLREKVLAQASQKNIIIVDEAKLSASLGEKWAVPVEVIVFAENVERAFLESIGAKVTLRVSNSGAFITDEGNHILDCNFGIISDPAALAVNISQRAGVVEHGLFVGLATHVIVAGAGGVRFL